jgi:hypothetical protein
LKKVAANGVVSDSVGVEQQQRGQAEQQRHHSQQQYQCTAGTGGSGSQGHVSTDSDVAQQQNVMAEQDYQ